jgi:hypothetical protein
LVSAGAQPGAQEEQVNTASDAAQSVAARARRGDGGQLADEPGGIGGQVVRERSLPRLPGVGGCVREIELHDLQARQPGGLQ